MFGVLFERPLKTGFKVFCNTLMNKAHRCSNFANNPLSEQDLYPKSDTRNFYSSRLINFPLEHADVSKKIMFCITTLKS